MLMQDENISKGVNWIDSLDGKKLAHDDSTNDLLYKENPEPITTHKEVQDKKSIMKV